MSSVVAPVSPSLPSRRTQLFGSLCSIVFLVNIARIVFAPLVEVFRSEFGMTAGAAGLVATMAWLGSAAPRLPTGYLLTRVRRHRVVLGTGAVLTVASAFTASANSVTALYAGALCMGLASGAYFISANPLVSELYPDRVGRAIGIHGGASQIAAVAAAPLVTAALAVGTWRTAFRAIGVAAALSTLALYVTARRTDLPSAGASDRDLLGAVRRQWPIVASGVVILGTTGFVWNGVFNLYVTYLVETKGVGEPLARNLLTVVFAAGVPAFFLTGRLADRFSHVPLMLSILGAFVVCLFALTVVGGVWPVVVVSAVIGYVIHSLFPAMDTYLLDSLPDENRASAYAVYSATMMLVQATGSVVVGTLVDAGIAFDVVFRSFAAVLALVLVGLLALALRGRLPSDGRPA